LRIYPNVDGVGGRVTINPDHWSTAGIRPPTGREISVTGITLSPSEIEMMEGDPGRQLAPSIIPATATNRNVTWTSSDLTIATVTGGLVHALKEGTATITVRTADGGHTASVTVTVKSATIGVDKITVSPNPLNLTVNSGGQLNVEVLPANASDKTVTWSVVEPNTVIGTQVNSTGWVTTGSTLGTLTVRATSVSNARIDDVTVHVMAGLSPGTITAGTICSGYTHTFMQTPATGGIGEIQYRWEWRAVGAPTWTEGTPTTTADLTTPSLTADREYRRGARNGTSGDWSYTEIVRVTVNSAPAQPSEMEFSATSVTLNGTFTASVTNVADVTRYTWVVPSGFTITSGQNTHQITITANSVGTHQRSGFTVTPSNDCGNGMMRIGGTGTIIVETGAPPTTEVFINHPNQFLLRGDSFHFSDVTTIPVGVPITSWSSSNPAAVTVSQTGVATAVGNGQAWITASTADGGMGHVLVASSDIRMESATVEYPGFLAPFTIRQGQLPQITITLKVGEEVTPIITTDPANSFGLAISAISGYFPIDSGNPNYHVDLHTGKIRALRAGSTGLSHMGMIVGSNGAGGAYLLNYIFRVNVTD
jgi:uncharacterized protein YjdB